MISYFLLFLLRKSCFYEVVVSMEALDTLCGNGNRCTNLYLNHFSRTVWILKSIRALIVSRLCLIINLKIHRALKSDFLSGINSDSWCNGTIVSFFAVMLPSSSLITIILRKQTIIFHYTIACLSFTGAALNGTSKAQTQFGANGMGLP
uniref:Putative secreted protein n=1 Tax=Anopheles darlingi TaxID=43151 RepID=A0A2M4DGE4_ANODA